MASYGFVPEYISLNTQKCLSFLFFSIISSIFLHLLASDWNKLSREPLSGIFIYVVLNLFYLLIF